MHTPKSYIHIGKGKDKITTYISEEVSTTEIAVYMKEQKAKYLTSLEIELPKTAWGNVISELLNLNVPGEDGFICWLCAKVEATYAESRQHAKTGEITKDSGLQPLIEAIFKLDDFNKWLHMFIDHILQQVTYREESMKPKRQ